MAQEELKEILEKHYAYLRGADLSHVDLIVYTQGYYKAYIQSDKTRIGCKYHPNKKCKAFTDEEINEMASDALEWWKLNKEIIFKIMDSLKEEFKNVNFNKRA